MEKQKKNVFLVHTLAVALITYVVLHIVHVSDAAAAAKSTGLGTVNLSGLNAVTAGLLECVTAPFNFKGLVLRHALIPLFFCNAFYILTAYKIYLDTLKDENTNWWKDYARWFGQEIPGLIPAISVFKKAGMEKVKNAETGEMEEKFVEHQYKLPDWEGYQKYMITPWTDEDKAIGRADPNVLIGRFPKNAPFSGDVKFSIDPGITNRNLLTLVIGGSGTGKTFKYVDPNLAQMNCSFVVTDPKGEIYENLGKMLLEDGYRVWRLSTTDLYHCNCYNPLDYVYDVDGNPDQSKITKLVNTFMNTSKAKGAKGGDPFWDKSAKAWLTFAVIYVTDFLPEDQRNFYQIMKLAQLGKSDEDSSSSQSQLDKLIDAARLQNPKSKCFEFYDIYAIAPAKTRNSILISIGVDLAPFAEEALCNVTSTSYVCKRDKSGLITEYIKDKQTGRYIKDSSNIDIMTIGDRKTALFIITATADDPYQFLVSLLYSQLFSLLYEQAEKIARNSWHIFGANGIVLTSEYQTKEIAEEVRQLYADAEVKSVTVKGVERHYLFNPKAGTKYTLPEKLAEKKGNVGWMEEIYSPEIGEKLIAQYKTAKVKHGGFRLPMPTRLLLDEFANISEIPNFDQYLATMRQYQISCTIILQTIAQLKKIYDKSTPTMIGNCDTIIFLGSPDVGETCKTLSEQFGKTVGKVTKRSESKQDKGGSQSANHDIKEQPLISPDQLANMSDDDCIVKIRGYMPMKLLKLSFAEHPNFYKSGQASDDNKLLDEFTNAHYKCLPKQMSRNTKQETVEDTSSQINDGIDPLSNKRVIRKRKMAGTPFNNQADLAGALGTTEEELPKVMKQATGIPREDRDTTGAMSSRQMPPNEGFTGIEDWEFKTDTMQNPPSDDDPPVNVTMAQPASSTTGTGNTDSTPGPNSSAWLFE